MATSPSPQKSGTPRTMRWLWGVWLVVFGLTAALEGRRFGSAVESPLGAVSWLTFWDIETTLPFLVLLLLPVVVLLSRTPQSEVSSVPIASTTIASVIIKGLIIFTVAILCSWQIGAAPVSVPGQFATTTVPFADLPPAYHDEYSYLLQARTFAAGRLSYPGMTVRPDLFHQMHVLNEHRTMSRYFPWTGMWMALFESAGRVVWGHWIAGALSAFCFYLALIQIADSRAAFLGGILIAVSPGISVFSNLLLAHHPTMLALSIFTCAFFRMMSTGRLRFAFVAGIGLTLAMLGRPMTAAGFGLPFGIWLLCQIVAGRGIRLTVGFAVPVVTGFCALGILNLEATGSVMRSGYQEYTDTFTPNHRYGFDNAAAKANENPKILTAYNDWATNLTPGLAAKNIWNRLFYSAQWTLGIFPLMFGVLMAFPVLWWGRTNTVAATNDAKKWGLRLLAFSFVSLHVVHIPYWYDGIMHWHYVFETAPIMLLLTAVGIVFTTDQLCTRMSRAMAITWTSGLLIVGLLPGWFEFAPFDNTSKVSAAISELSFARGRLEFFKTLTEATTVLKPALILVDERESDPQLSYVVNDPELKSDVIKCRRPDTDPEIEELAAAFPKRTIYIFDPKLLRLTKL